MEWEQRKEFHWILLSSTEYLLNIHRTLYPAYDGYVLKHTRIFRLAYFLPSDSFSSLNMGIVSTPYISIVMSLKLYINRKSIVFKVRQI